MGNIRFLPKILKTSKDQYTTLLKIVFSGDTASYTDYFNIFSTIQCFPVLSMVNTQLPNLFFLNTNKNKGWCFFLFLAIVWAQTLRSRPKSKNLYSNPDFNLSI